MRTCFTSIRELLSSTKSMWSGNEKIHEWKSEQIAQAGTLAYAMKSLALATSSCYHRPALQSRGGRQRIRKNTPRGQDAAMRPSPPETMATKKGSATTPPCSPHQLLQYITHLLINGHHDAAPYLFPPPPMLVMAVEKKREDMAQSNSVAECRGKTLCSWKVVTAELWFWDGYGSGEQCASGAK